MRCRFGLLAFFALALIAGCAQPGTQPPRLAPVAALPAPAKPAWITEIAPQGTVKNRAQIRVIFASPVLTVGQLGANGERRLLAHFQIRPAIPGGFVALTPRMITFQSESELPPSTRMRITLTRGLADMQGHRLDRDLAWTFQTAPLQLRVPEGEPTPGTLGLMPAIRISSNAALDAESFAQHAAFVSQSSGNVPARAALASPQPGDGTYVYTVSPASPLRKASSYRLRIEPGVLPANGNRAGETALNVPVTTYAPLAFAAAQPTADPLASGGNPRFAGGDPALVFNSALDPKTFERHVTVKPALGSAGHAYSLSDDGSAILVNPYALSANTAYTFTFDARLQDVFGQQLGKAVSVRYTTGDLAPYFWAPSGANVFLSSQRLALQYNALNLPGNRYRAAYRVVTPQRMANTDLYSASQVLPSPAAWPAHAVPGAARNTQVTIGVPLRQRLGGSAGVLAYGAAAPQSSYPFYGMVQLTNLGVFAQWFPQSGYVMVQRLSDGMPAGGAHVDVYASHAGEASGLPARVCASGTTNAAGVFRIAGTTAENCYAGDRPADQAPQIYVAVRKGGDWAFVRTYAWSGIYQYANDIGDTTWSQGQPISRGIIYSDRQMYQPGERGWFTAVCYVLQNGALRGDRDARYTLVLSDPNGKQTKLPPRTTNRYATFSFPIDFAKTQTPGYYTLTATSPGGAQITGSLRVAQFRPPNFSVDLKLGQQFAAAGDSVAVQGSAQYLFGAPMAGAKAGLHVTREQAYFTPKGWDAFTFGRQWFWPEQQPEVDAEAGQQQRRLDANGKMQSVVAVATALPYALTYRVDLEVTDASNLASSATQSFTALPSTTLIGLNADYVGTAGKPVSTAVIVTDPQGKPVSGTHVHLELQKMTYSGVTQVVEGSEEARNQVQYTTVASADAVSGTAPQSVQLTAKDSGSYRIRANLAGASGDAAETDAQVWITGPGQAAWGAQNPSQLQLKLDKRTYRAGDTATLAVASPYGRADLYLSVVRDRVLYETLVHVDGSAPRVRIPIEPSMFPNAAVEGVLVRRGAPLTSKNAQGVDSLVRIGMVPLALDLRERYLKVSIAPARAKIAPHTQQRVRFKVTDASGRPVRGQVTVAVVDDAILQLNGYRPPDLVKTVFAAQPISTRFDDNRPNVTLAQPSDTAEKGWGYGGGFLAGAAGTRVRTQFVRLAYFNGSVQTASDGTADVTFTTPDNLTTWRILAVAATAESTPRFGTADGTFVTSKPLVTDPLLPQFVRPGDRFEGGVLLMNAGSTPVDARTQALLSGALTFASPAGSQTMQTQQQFGPGMNAWRFPMVAGTSGTASMQFRTQIASGASGASDAFRVPLEIRTSGATETTMDSGATASSANVPLTIGTSGGTVRVDVAGSLLPQALQPAAKALRSDDLALLSPLAARLSIAASLAQLQRARGSAAGSVDAKKTAAQAIAQIAALQRTDGGFGFWPQAAGSEPFGTAEAVRALAYAAKSGIAVPHGIIARAKPYLVRVLGDPSGSAKWCTDPACKRSARLAMLRALAATGDRRTDFLPEIYAQRGDLDVAGQVELALYLQRTPGWNGQAGTLYHELSQTIYETGRYANVQPEGAWSGTPVEAQAAYVQLLLERRAKAADTDRALRALVAQNCRCGWPGLSDTAAALQAVAAYSAAQREPANFTAQIAVDGKPAGSARFTSDASAPQTFALSDLRAGSHTLTLRKTGSGTLHYLVTYTYPIAANAPGQLQGLRVVRTVRPANGTKTLALVDLAPAAQPLDFPAGNVYDVGIQVMVDHPVDRVLITDPLPAGFEALDTSFQTTAAYYQPLSTDWQIDYQQIYADRIVAYAQHLNPGVYAFHYLVRSVTPGTFQWPGADAYLLDAPEQFGRASFRTVRVTP